MFRRVTAGLVIGLAAAVLALAVSGTAWLDRVEGVTWDWRVRAFARPGEATERVYVILLDQYSLDWAFQELKVPWPWYREVYTAILEFLHAGGARSVAFDVLFTEDSYIGVYEDEQLGEAIRSGPPFVAAVHLSRRRGHAEWPAPWAGRLGIPIREAEAIPSSAHMSAAALPIPELAEPATVFGHVTAEPDADGIIRRATPWMMFAGEAVPFLGLAAALAPEHAQGRLPAIVFRPGSVRIGDRTIPWDKDGRVRLRYRGPQGTHRTFTAASIIQSWLRLQSGEAEPVVDPDEFRDAYVLFGFSAPGLMDLRPTPLSRVYPGVEIHATFLDNYLSGDFIREGNRMLAVGWTLLLGLAVGGGLVCSRRVGVSAVAGLLGLALPGVVSFLAYPRGWAWPLVSPSLTALLSVMGAWLFNYATEGRQKAFIKQAFRHYLSPAVIERLLQDPSRLQLGGERRELSIFFSDLEGFSTIAERLEPTALTALLNAYLSDMTDIILEEGGTLDKYEGDAIIAFWNAPLPQPDHAVRAVRAALRCHARLLERGPDYLASSGAELRMRVGIHTGEVVVGNLGSRERFDYTVLGDAANLASRLEGANKAFGTGLMVSDVTWDQTGGTFIGRTLGRLRVVGRKTPVRVYEPLAEAGLPMPAAAEAFGEALSLFEAGRLDEAESAFSALADRDPASSAYAKRCRELREQGKGTEDGVWTLASK